MNPFARTFTLGLFSRSLVGIFLVSALLTPIPAQSGVLDQCFILFEGLAGRVSEFRAQRERARWKKANEKNVGLKKRVLPLETPGEIGGLKVDTSLLDARAGRAAQDLRRPSEDLGVFGRQGAERDFSMTELMERAEQESLLSLAKEVRNLAMEHVYTTSEPVQLVHGSETDIQKFDVNYNLNAARSVESVTSGPGVYTFRRTGEEFPVDLLQRAPTYVYEFSIPKGSTVLDLNDPSVNRMIERVMKVSEGDYRREVQRMREAATARGEKVGLGDYDIMRSLAIHDLWHAVGEPDLVIGTPYGESEIVVKNPALVSGFTNPIVSYPKSLGVRQGESQVPPSQRGKP